MQICRNIHYTLIAVMDTRFATKELCVAPDATVMMQRAGKQHLFHHKTRLSMIIDMNNNHASAAGVGLIEVKVNTKLELQRTIWTSAICRLKLVSQSVVLLTKKK